jgi:hypothetical protein
MPYLNQSRKDQLAAILYEIEKFLTEDALEPGDLNYLISATIDMEAELRTKRPRLAKASVNYAFYNSMIGALECAKLELYRRAVAPYEDKAIERNGDVYFHTS